MGRPSIRETKLVVVSPPGDPAKPPRRLRRALIRIAVGTGLVCTFAAGTVGAIALSLNLPPTRRIVTRVTNDLLGSLFDGKIVAHRIGHLGIHGVRIDSASAFDPDGNETIRVVGLTAHADVLGMVEHLLFDKGDRRIVIPFIRIESADVRVDRGPEGMTLARTFTPRTSTSTTPASSTPSAPSRKTTVALQRIDLDHAFVHGRLAPSVAIDGDVNRLVARLSAGSDGVVLDVDQTGLVERRLLGTTTEGTANYHLRVSEGPTDMWADLTGRVGGIELLVRARLIDSELRASASAPRVEPAAVARLIPALQPTEPLAARATVMGTLPHLSFTAELGDRDLTEGHSLVRVTGKFDAADPLRLEANVKLSDADLHAFDARLPTSRLDAAGRVRVELGETLRVAAEARVEPTILLGQKIPGTLLHAVLDRGTVTGRFSADEPGMPISGAFVVQPDGALHFDARGVVASIDQAPRLRGSVHGSARVHVFGVYRDEQLDARVDAAASGLRLPGDLALQHADAHGRLSGPLADLRIEASATGSEMHAVDYRFDRVRASVQGTLNDLSASVKLESDDGAALSASARIDPKTGTARAVKLSMTRDGTEATGSIAHIRPKRGGLAVEGLELSGEGLGTLEGTLRVANADVTGTLKGESVDLSRLAKLAGIPYRVRGLADVDIELKRNENGRAGHVRVALEGGEGPFVSGVSAMVAASFHGEQVEADGLIRLVTQSSPATPAAERCDGAIAQVRLTNGKGRLDGPLLDPKTWLALTGEAEVAAEDWNLRCLKRLVPVGLPISDLSGSLTAKLKIARASGARFPSIQDLSLRTKRLEVAGPEPLGSDEPEWESRFVDVQLRGGLDGKSGRTTGQMTLWDGGLLGDLEVNADLDLATLMDHPGYRLATLADSPMQVRLGIPRRTMASLSTLPSFLRERLPPLSGELRLDAYADGTASHPFVTAHAFGWQLAAASTPAETLTGPGPWSMPVDADVIVTYDGETASLDGRISREGRNLGRVTGAVEADLHALVTSNGARSPWTGGFELSLDNAPLAELPFLSDRGIAGLVSGTVRVAGLHEAPTVDVDLELPGLRIGTDMFFEKAALSLHVQKHKGATNDTAIAKVELVGQDGGRLDASAYAGVEWEDALLPHLAFDSPADFYARADDFRATAFLPFVNTLVSKLDGYVDGELRFGFRRLSDGDKGSVTAKIELRDGVFHVPELGQELRHASVRLTADPSGDVRLSDIHAEGISGEIDGWIQGRLDGLKFLDAGGQFTIAKGRELPLAVEGVPLGEAYGEIRITARKEHDSLIMDIGLPTFHLALPASSRRNTQSLDDNPDITISHPLGPHQEPPKTGGQRLVFNLDLGQVQIEGRGIDLTVTSAKGAERPRVVVTDRVQLSGEIDLVKGTFNVMGKDFRLEQGLVRMRPESPTNPFVNISARWDAPDGSPVYVDYIGDLQPITADKLKFRGGGRSQAEVVAMLLGEESEAGGTSASTQTRAIGAGGAYVADQLNAALHGVAPGFSTGIAQTEEGALKTSISYQIDDNITASAAYQQQANQLLMTPGAAYGVCISDRPGAACTELGVEWRLGRHVSVRGAVGGVGDTLNSAFDLLWKYRY
jgi:translocation and assembly module TamB